MILKSRSLQRSLAGIRGTRRDVHLPASAPHTLPALWAAAFSETARTVLVILPRPEDAANALHALRLYTPPHAPLFEWPAHDFLPYERGGAQPETEAVRLRVLEELYRARQGGVPALVMTSWKALSEPTLAADYLERHRLEVSTGSVLPLVQTTHALAASGYRAQPLVDTPGSFSRRGGILDLWTPSQQSPVRIELFGDEVDSIRLFDPHTQRSEATLQDAIIIPPVELPLEEAPEALERVRSLDLSTLRAEVRSEWEQMLLELETGGLRPTYGGLAPYFRLGMGSLLDHLPDDTLIASAAEERLRLVADSLHAQAGEIRTELEDIGEVPRGLERPYHTLDELAPKLASFAQLQSSAGPEDTVLLGSVSGFAGNTERMVETLSGWAREKRRVIILTRQADRVRHLLSEHNLPLLSSKVSAPQPPEGAITVGQGIVPEGWISSELNTVLLGDGELWGYVEPRRPSGPRRNKTPTFLADLQPGGWVVHIDHGIARYVGNVSRGRPGAEREYLLLEYASGDKLYVPVDQVDRVSPYIGAGGVPAPSRLGTADWARTKSRVKRSTDELAKELLKIYAARSLSKGFSYSPDGSLQREFEHAFPYVETEDQLRTIDEVKADMESPRPMDRLVCGDVGYGKTEVALRAAFKAIVDGKQVAVLVPTTVLALQHFETFKHRLAAFPVRVEMLSRLRSKKERDATVAALRTGAVDVVIGTHRLLSKDVVFRDLGLLIVDEEQRFGVKHKETLKKLRTEVDVLTLTATPIPRTLQMALAGVRDMSVIETPPDDRLPIKTYVTPKSDTLIRESVLREMDRGGQVFYVHNRVHNIAKVARDLNRVVPEARIAVGHGQMHEDELEKVMLSFVKSEQDVLLSTTIIESGLDIPNANTLLVDDAANFGLAQLYQLRGRVGRGTHRAYAYLMYKPHSAISEDAQKRLEAISQATELGAGFRIAMKDLELRGAGNFLGPEQSGQVALVGLELYTRLLERAVHEARTGEVLPEPPAVSVDLPVDASLPEEYIADRDTRLRLYRRLSATATGRDLRLIEAELRDRFGPLPEPATNLVQLIELKLLASSARVTAITVVDGELVLRTRRQPAQQPRIGRTWARVLPGQVRFHMSRGRDRWMAELRSVLGQLEEDAETVAPKPEQQLSASGAVH